MTLRTGIGFWLVLVACKDTPPPPSCGDLASAGCPIDNGADVCKDVTCSGVYECENGTWVFLQSCPNYNPEAGVQPFEASDDGPALPDVSIDAPPGAYGGPGCVDLENPDCPLGTAIACSGTIDCCDCQDLYVCTDGDWVPWGECTDAGIVQTGH